MSRPSAARAQPTTLRPPIQDLREWLARVEEMGELTRIDRPVSRDEEMSAISYLVAKQQPSPAVLFERPRGFDDSPIGARMLWNILGPSFSRVALTLEEPVDTTKVELIRHTKDKLKRRIPPREISAEQAPIYQNSVLGSDINLDQLPIPRHWPLDGGRYAGTGDAVITRDPDTGYLNIGTYRMMQQGKAETGLYLSPGKDARLHITRAWQQGKPIAVAAAWGIDPLFMLVGSQTFPKNISEYEFAGGITDQVIWAMASRCNPIDDVDILRNTWSTWLDPTQNPPEKRPYSSKALINACKEHRHLPSFSKRTTLRKSIYDDIAARWKELGLPGQIPTVRAFEADSKVVYHEVGGFEPGRQPVEPA